MTITAFPPLDSASPEGLLAIGGDMELESLLLAYQSGIFPWPTHDFPLLWFAPPRRAVLDFRKFKVPRRLQRELKTKQFHFAVDRDFAAVIRGCALGRTRQSRGTWITEDLRRAYIHFHRAGYAHSFEAYDRHNQLAGGLYGVSLGSMFAGESMFYSRTGASKAALIFAVGFLKARGAKWMDVQTMSPLVASLGAKEIPRSDFMKRLKRALRDPPIFECQEKSLPSPLAFPDLT